MDRVLVERRAVVAEARQWVGTPYRHQAALCGGGCDCLGLVRGVYRALYGTEPERVPAYEVNWGLSFKDETLTDGLARHLVPTERNAAKPGDVLVFRLRDRYPARHAAIQSTPDQMIHAWERGAVCEVYLSAPWRRRIAHVFSFPDVQN